MQSSFLTDHQLAARLGVSRPTVWRWKKAGLIPQPCRLGPRVVRWPVKAIEQWEAEQIRQAS